MSFIVFIVCLVIVVGRRRRGATLVVPAIIGGLALLGSISAIMGLVEVFHAVASVNPADKATILAAGISEAVSSVVIGLVVEVPLLAGAYFVDRWLRKRQAPTTNPTAGHGTQSPATQAAPAGSMCATHSDRTASLICVRCGGFACDSCSALDRRHCQSCFERSMPTANRRLAPS